MIECPDCGKHFRGAKCSCGYEPPKSNPAEVAARMRAVREHDAREHERKNQDYAKAQEVRANVPQVGKKRWAYEVLAIKEAGLSISDYSVQLAKAALHVQNKEAA